MDLQQLAELYFNRKLYVYPFRCGSCVPEWRKEWNGHTQTLEEVKLYNWKDAGSIYAVAGKKGIRVIDIRLEKTKYKKWFIERALEMLNLPIDYDWITVRGNEYSIIIETADDRKGDLNRTCEFTRLYWQDYFLLPTGNPNFHFLGNFIPKQRPTHIENEHLFSCLETIEEEIRDSVETEGFIREANSKMLNKVKIFFSNIFIGIFSIIALALFAYIFFKGCNSSSHYDPDHVHFERFHQ